MQNDDGAAVADLVAGLNARPGAGAVRVRRHRLHRHRRDQGGVHLPAGDGRRPSAPSTSSTRRDDPTFIDTRNRPALIQTFEEVATGERFTAAINHFKSKGSACTPRRPRPRRRPGQLQRHPHGGGRGARRPPRRPTRPAAATPTSSSSATSTRTACEDPITTLEAPGYTDLIERVRRRRTPTATCSTASSATSTTPSPTRRWPARSPASTEWHVNADELAAVRLQRHRPRRRRGRRSSASRRRGRSYDADARRSSDHDPVVVGLDLSSLHHRRRRHRRRGRAVAARWRCRRRSTATSTSCPTVHTAGRGRRRRAHGRRPASADDTCVALTSRGVVTFDLASGKLSAAVLSLPARSASDRQRRDVRRAPSTAWPTSPTSAGRRTGSIWVDDLTTLRTTRTLREPTRQLAGRPDSGNVEADARPRRRGGPTPRRVPPLRDDDLAHDRQAEAGAGQRAAPSAR